MLAPSRLARVVAPIVVLVVIAAQLVDVNVASATTPAAVTFSGSSQVANATATWTVGFTTSSSGSLANKSTITVTFNSGFTIPASPTITLTGGFASCTATGSATSNVVTVTLGHGTCALATSTTGTFTIAGITNPAAGSYAASTFSVATSVDTTPGFPVSAIVITPPPTPTSVTFSGVSQVANATTTWTVGLTSSSTGALATGNTVTATFNAGFTIPTNPTIALTGGFVNCSATASTTSNVVTITLANSGGTCALANSTAGTLTIAGITNPAAGSYAANTFSVATSMDTLAASPGAAVVITAATTPTSVTFSGSSLVANAMATWTEGFTTSSTGSLAATNTIMVTFSAGFTAPATPTITLVSGFSHCSATGTGASNVVTVTLANSGGTCALANSTAGTLTIAGITNPAANTYAATTFSLSTSQDSNTAHPASAIVITATTPTSVTFSGSTTALAGSTGNSFTFTFTAPATGAFGAGSEITLTIPTGWSAPQTTTSGGPGYTTTAASGCTPGSPSTSGTGPWTVTVPMSCAASTAFTVTYADATAPTAVGAVPFTTASEQGATGLVNLTTQPTVTVNPAAESKLFITTEPASSITAGSTVSLTVTIEDQYGNLIVSPSTGNNDSIHVTLSSGVFAAGTTTLAASSGIASFSGLELNTVNSYTITASDTTHSGVTAAATTPIAVTPATVSSLAITTAPGAFTAGGSTTAVVTAYDQYANVATNAADSLTLTETSGPSSSLAGLGPVTLSSGTANFTISSITAGTYTVTGHDGAINSSASGSFTVSPGAPATLAFVQQPSNAYAAVAMTPALTVQVEDAYGNAVSDSGVSITLSPSANSIASGATASTGSTGLATLSPVMNTAALNLALTASASGLSSSAASNTFTVSALVSSAAAALTDIAADAGSGIASVAYYYCSGFGGTCTASTWTTIGSSSVATGNYPVSWTHPTSSGPYEVVVVATDKAGNKTTSSITPVTIDTSAPTGGALTVDNTAASLAGTTSTTASAFSIGARTDYTDNGSGLASSILTVQSETYSGGVCGSAGSGGPYAIATAVSGTTQPGGIVANYCYLYTLTGTDNAGNSASIQTTVAYS